ncbi:MAG TPA: metallophosphoesterase family protein [Candidatus Thermoplasmatota archaeon]|nr:metallophosphoesterase family protein [Candidatus Thermoplasmatota archaeon]
MRAYNTAGGLAHFRAVVRVVVLSDIHSNLHALEAVLDEVRSLSPDLVLNLGDTVGYNAHPREAWRKIRSVAHLTLLGNHDWAALADRADPAAEGAMSTSGPSASSGVVEPLASAIQVLQETPDGALARFNPQARAAVEHTRRSLEPEDLRAIAALRPSGLLERDGVRFEAFHASPFDPLWDYVLPDRAAATLESHLAHADPGKGRHRFILLGHTHVPVVTAPVAVHHPSALGSRPGRVIPGSGEVPNGGASQATTSPGVARLVNPGSVGQPRDGDPRAAFALIDLARDVVEIRRVAYDVDAAAAAVRATGLPRALADRLHFGR